MCSERAELLPAGMPAAHNDIAMTSCRTRASATLGIARSGRGATPPKGVAPRNGARRTYTCHRHSCMLQRRRARGRDARGVDVATYVIAV